jgi:hypothetical protein
LVWRSQRPDRKNTFSISRVLLQDSERLQSGNIKIMLLTVEILGKYGGRKKHENRYARKFYTFIFSHNIIAQLF